MGLASGMACTTKSSIANGRQICLVNRRVARNRLAISPLIVPLGSKKRVQETFDIRFGKQWISSVG